MEKEYLEFFKDSKTSKELFEKFGYKTGTDILKKLFEEGFIKHSEDKKRYHLSGFGKKKLKELKNESKKIEKKEFLNKPLNVAIICIILTAFVTYVVTIKSIDYENTLSVSLYGKQEIILKPKQKFQFNSIIIYNPASKKVNLEKIYIKNDYNWIRWNNAQKEEKEQINIPSENNKTTEYDIPKLESDYKPYMEIEAGESRIINGLFFLTSPIKEGDYKLYFIAKTLDGKEYKIDRPLIIKIIEE